MSSESPDLSSLSRTTPTSPTTPTTPPPETTPTRGRSDAVAVKTHAYFHGSMVAQDVDDPAGRTFGPAPIFRRISRSDIRPAEAQAQPSRGRSPSEGPASAAHQEQRAALARIAAEKSGAEILEKQKTQASVAAEPASKKLSAEEKKALRQDIRKAPPKAQAEPVNVRQGVARKVGVPKKEVVEETTYTKFTNALTDILENSEKGTSLDPLFQIIEGASAEDKEGISRQIDDAEKKLSKDARGLEELQESATENSAPTKASIEQNLATIASKMNMLIQLRNKI